MVRKAAFAGLVVMLAVPGGRQAHAQAQDPARGRRRSAESRRHSIRMMEAVLSRAVLGGAEQLAEQLGNGSPNMSFFTGQARAHGFQLEGYGVFFHVEIPEMQTSLVLSVTTLERDMAVANALESVRRAVGSVPEGAPKIEAENRTEAARGAGRADAGAGRRPRECRRPQHDSRREHRAGRRPAGPARPERRLSGRHQGRA